MSAAQPAYTPPEASILSEYVFFPVYDRLVTLYPRWWSPNAITLVGIACTTLSSALLLWATASTGRDGGYFGPSGVSLVPQWDVNALPHASLAMDAYTQGGLFLVVCGVLNLIYCVADNTDGRQARRTRRSSHIGEYLDHGLDCCTSLVSTFLVVTLLGVEASAAAAAVLGLSLTTQLCHSIHLQENVFLWGNRWVSVDEAMVLFGVGPIFAAAAPALGWAQVGGVRFVAVAFAAYVAAQAQLTISMLARKWTRIADPATLLILLNAFMFALLSRGAPSARGAPWRGRFDAAGWVVGAAVAASIIIHETIAAKCMRRRAASLRYPCLALPVVWTLLAAGVPVAAAVAAVALHTRQIVTRCRDIARVKMSQ